MITDRTKDCILKCMRKWQDNPHAILGITGTKIGDPAYSSAYKEFSGWSTVRDFAEFVHSLDPKQIIVISIEYE